MVRLSALVRWLATVTVLNIAGPAMVLGYIPASPSNDTQMAKDDGSQIFVKRPANTGTFTQALSYQQVASGSRGFSAGALVQFSDDIWRNVSTVTPWIALVSCDQNSTNSRSDVDTLVLARDSGAVGMVLYSIWSETCVLNNAFRQFDAILDLYTTTRKSAGQLIQSQLQSVNDTTYATFNPSLLDANSKAVKSSLLTKDGPNASPYLVATLRAWNTTTADIPDSSDSSSSSVGKSNGSPTISSRMTTIYAIMGIVPFLFLGGVV